MGAAGPDDGLGDDLAGSSKSLGLILKPPLVAAEFERGHAQYSHCANILF